MSKIGDEYAPRKGDFTDDDLKLVIRTALRFPLPWGTMLDPVTGKLHLVAGNREIVRSFLPADRGIAHMIMIAVNATKMFTEVAASYEKYKSNPDAEVEIDVTSLTGNDVGSTLKAAMQAALNRLLHRTPDPAPDATPPAAPDPTANPLITYLQQLLDGDPQ